MVLKVCRAFWREKIKYIPIGKYVMLCNSYVVYMVSVDSKFTSETNPHTNMVICAVHNLCTNYPTKIQ